MECNLVWNQTRDYKIWFHTKIARHEVLLPLYYIHFEITILKQIRNIYLEKFNYSGSTELYIVMYIIHNILRKVEFGAFLISSPDWLTCLTSIIWLAEKWCNLIINRTQNWCNSWLNCTLVNQSECRICLWFHNEYNKCWNHLLQTSNQVWNPTKPTNQLFGKITQNLSF